MGDEGTQFLRDAVCRRRFLGPIHSCSYAKLNQEQLFLSVKPHKHCETGWLQSETGIWVIYSLNYWNIHEDENLHVFLILSCRNRNCKLPNMYVLKVQNFQEFLQSGQLTHSHAVTQHNRLVSKV